MGEHVGGADGVVACPRGSIIERRDDSYYQRFYLAQGQRTVRMIAIRDDQAHGTEIAVYAHASALDVAYRIVCLNFDYDVPADRRDLPTAWIHVPGIDRLTIEDMQRLAAEYTEVAAIAEQLQAEKRAAYTSEYG